MDRIDLQFGLVVGLSVLTLGLGSAALVGGWIAPPVIEKPRPPAPSDYRSQLLSAGELGQRVEIRRARKVLSEFKPAVPLRAWRGVVLEEGGGTNSTEEVLATYEASLDHVEGPPFHFICSRTGRITSTRRWKNQKSWRRKGLPHENDWIVLRLLCSREEKLVSDLIKALQMPFVSKGALVLRDPEGRLIVVEQGRDR